MTKQLFNIAVDAQGDAAYVTLSDAEVVRTRQLNGEVLVDLDEFGVAVGIEFLRMDAEIPFTDLVEKYHVHSDVVEKIRRLRPSIKARLTFGTDGVTTSVDHLNPVVA